MKNILISIQPKWCNLIASGKKTIELRKTMPKLETPFKCYIYCTNGFADTETNAFRFGWRGRVIGEFMCDSILRHCEMGSIDIAEQCSCVSRKDIREYSQGKEVFGWNISDLIIYDKPKALSEFLATDEEAVKQCVHRERVYNNPESTNGALLLGSYFCEDKSDWCTKCKTKPIRRPPQSWCYVEENWN